MSLRTMMMRAIQVSQFGGPEVLKLASDVAVPQPSENQVLIRTHVAGVNPVDTYLRNGAYPPAFLPKLPYTAGKDASGVVEAIGKNVSKYKKGDRVYCSNTSSGSYAEYCLSDEHTTMRLSDKLSFTEGAAVGIPYCTAYRGLVTKCRAKAGETVLVHGASGGVGVAACQIAHSLCLTVLGTAGSSAGMDLVQQNGAHKAFNHSLPDYKQQIMSATNERGVDIILEMLANVNLESDLQLAALQGRIAVIGSRGTIEVTPRFAMGKELSIHGVQLQHTSKEDYHEMEEFLYSKHEEGQLRPAVGQVFTLDQVADAHRHVVDHPGGSKGKIVISIRD